MASHSDSFIKIVQEHRPCLVRDIAKRDLWVGAVFHLWSQDIDESGAAYPAAIVEYSNGEIKSVFCERLKMLDSSDYCFPKAITENA